MSINKVLNVNDCWIDIKKVAELKGVTKRAVRLAIQRNKYISKTIQTSKGQSYQILLSSLEKDIQQKFLDEHYTCLLQSQTGDAYKAGCSLEYKNILHLSVGEHESLTGLGARRVEPEKPLVFIQPKQEQIIPDKARELALAKYDLVNLWVKFKKENPPTKTANKTFIELYNTKVFAPEIFKKLGKTTIGSIYRWHKTLSG
ncbi:MAG: hypothetical protein PHV68_01615, partial [Candidatus Gastranaerophilales bacterium]|nr:hypothetical protein [Candidatus Gastranaerophilales bacterium]